MTNAILKQFNNCATNGCLVTVSHSEFKVYDREEDCCYICTDNEPNSLSFFAVKNPREKPISFLAIDKCLIPEDDEKKCDCAIFDDRTFHFVEIKTASTGQRSKRRVKAFEQLKNTIGIFRQTIDFDEFELFAMVCIGCKGVYPRATASHMGRRMEMSMLYKAKLVEGNLIEF